LRGERDGGLRGGRKRGMKRNEYMEARSFCAVITPYE
jgi:hypothetical protein